MENAQNVVSLAKKKQKEMCYILKNTNVLHNKHHIHMSVICACNISTK